MAKQTIEDPSQNRDSGGAAARRSESRFLEVSGITILSSLTPGDFPLKAKKAEGKSEVERRSLPPGVGSPPGPETCTIP
jgi:hypothetical protein